MSRPLSHDSSDVVADDTRPKKNTILATVLNTVLPGAGFAYLGRWKWALINFLIVQAIIVGCIMFPPDPKIVEHILWLVLVLGVGSGSLAHTAARMQE